VLAIESERGAPTSAAATGCQVFGVSLGDEAHADVLTLITSLRRVGVRADMAYGSRGLKGAMKAADRSGARFAVLIGAEERKAATVRIKDLQDGDQQDVAATAATDWLVNKLTLGQSA
jgi:histidyl-tRNA synthetase